TQSAFRLLLCKVHGSEHSHTGDITSNKLSSPNADFAFALYKSLNAEAAPGKNIFYSPFGISTALSMVSAGARGETHSQLFSSLGYSAFNQTQVNEAYKHLFDIHGRSQKNLQLDVGNAAAVRSGFSPLEKFLNDVKQFYQGEIFNVNHNNLSEAAAEINRFIANKTQDMIKDMVKDLDPDMAMVLINYVYFKGMWEKPFNSDMTREHDFQVDKTTKVKVDMMTRTGNYKAHWDQENHTTVVMLPYKGKASMMIILPDKDKMKEVEGYITKDYIRHLKDSIHMSDGIHPNPLGSQMLSANIQHAHTPTSNPLSPVSPQNNLLTASPSPTPHTWCHSFSPSSLSSNNCHTLSTVTDHSTEFTIPVHVTCRLSHQHLSPVNYCNHSNLTQVRLQPLPQPTFNCTSANFGLLNIRSLNNKSFICLDFINHNNLDFFIVTETWLTMGDCSPLIEATPLISLTFISPGCQAGEGGCCYS
uniref:Serpin domain-containing protein n=1 Tax=Labrus bergylta TaxID=56723 RepID=A0A3Q3FGG3_9LABR